MKAAKHNGKGALGTGKVLSRSNAGDSNKAAKKGFPGKASKMGSMDSNAAAKKGLPTSGY